LLQRIWRVKGMICYRSQTLSCETYLKVRKLKLASQVNFPKPNKIS
jgi:hypothetical protein